VNDARNSRGFPGPCCFVSDTEAEGRNADKRLVNARRYIGGVFCDQLRRYNPAWMNCSKRLSTVISYLLYAAENRLEEPGNLNLLNGFPCAPVAQLDRAPAF